LGGKIQREGMKEDEIEEIEEHCRHVSLTGLGSHEAIDA
jgi:hypothetical protein